VSGKGVWSESALGKEDDRGRIVVIVVSDSGPLMALGKIGQLDLLPRLYGCVLLPTAVYVEIVVRGRKLGYHDAFLVQAAIKRGQLVAAEIRDEEMPRDINALPLDEGEKQTLCLALRKNADLLLFDDLKAREEAQARNLNVKGTLGVLVQGYREDLLTLEEFHSMIDVINDRDDIWIDEELCKKVLSKLKDLKRL